MGIGVIHACDGHRMFHEVILSVEYKFCHMNMSSSHMVIGWMSCGSDKFSEGAEPPTRKCVKTVRVMGVLRGGEIVLAPDKDARVKTKHKIARPPFKCSRISCAEQGIWVYAGDCIAQPFPSVYGFPLSTKLIEHIGKLCEAHHVSRAQPQPTYLEASMESLRVDGVRFCTGPATERRKDGGALVRVFHIHTSSDGGEVKEEGDKPQESAALPKWVRSIVAGVEPEPDDSFTRLELPFIPRPIPRTCGSEDVFVADWCMMDAVSKFNRDTNRML